MSFDQIDLVENERVFRLDDLPPVPHHVFSRNSEAVAAWLSDAVATAERVLLYVGFEAFYHPNFDQTAAAATSAGVPLVFSQPTKSTVKFMQNRCKYEAMERGDGDDSNWKGLVIHLGASHLMDGMVFGEDCDGHLQRAWQDGRMVLISQNLVVTPASCFRAGLAPAMRCLAASSWKTPARIHHETAAAVAVADDAGMADTEEHIARAATAVDQARTLEEVFVSVFDVVSREVGRGRLDVPCYWDAGWESFSLLKHVRAGLAERGRTLPFTKTSLVHLRNAAIGDSVHSFYASSPEAFPLVVAGDTAVLLAGGISLVNLHLQKRFGALVVLNNCGMKIEDVISKRPVDGHRFDYEYVQLRGKKDIFTLEQLKEGVKHDILGPLREYGWGVPGNQARAAVLNVDIQAVREDEKTAAGAGSSLDDDFGQRFRQLAAPRRQLEDVVDVLHRANGGRPVRIQGCSAVEFMELFSQFAMTSRAKLEYLPTPTDLMATRTLLPALIGSPAARFANANAGFLVLVSNAVFGTDGLNNMLLTQMESGCQTTLVHLVYDSATAVSNYMHIGQPHRQFGVRPSSLVPTLYRHHEAHDRHILLTSVADRDCAEVLDIGLSDPDVRAVIVDMGAPNLTGKALG